MFTLIALASTVSGLAIMAGAFVITRTAVPPNDVHIVQSRSKTTSYGGGSKHGNVYQNWAPWLPIIGVTRKVLPVSNFSIPLPDYEVYDLDRAQFLLDAVGFFVIDNTDVAAQRVTDFEHLKRELLNLMKGATRTVIAGKPIREILGDRKGIAKLFSDEVEHDLAAWGVKAVKSIELMDIRDVKGSTIIHDIQAMKAAEINKESRVSVANSQRDAERAEITAKQQVLLTEQDAIQAVGQRTASQEQAVGIAKEQAKQKIAEQAKETKTKDMNVLQVDTVRKAEIAKEAAIVSAQERKQTDIISAEAQKSVDVTKAEGEKAKTVLVAEGDLVKATKAAEGVLADGKAKAESKKLFEMARVEPELQLAAGIGAQAEYQDYLVRVQQVKAGEAVGVANASALSKANIQVFANSNDAAQSVASIGDLLGTGGGIKIGALLEGLKATESGRALLGKFVANDAEEPAPKKTA